MKKKIYYINFQNIRFLNDIFNFFIIFFKYRY